MKALSLWQPWASLVILGLKHYETRSWKTSYRGTLVIHAAKTWELTQVISLMEFEALLNIDLNGSLRGMALGTVDLVEMYTTDYLRLHPGFTETNECKFGDYSPGRYAWKLANPIAFAEPIPCQGHQRLWEVE